jgi:His-Xaa-Ser system radical SAM maturase HxsC
VAVNESVVGQMIEKSLNVLHIAETSCTLLINGKKYNLQPFNYEKLFGLTDGDVLLIQPNGVAETVYTGKDDATLFITSNCNSNCVMCPSSVQSRVSGHIERLDFLLSQLDYLPSDVPHITITGGEPLLLGNSIFPLLRKCGDNLSEAEFLLLTNGRGFCNKAYALKFAESAPKNMTVAIPIHAASEARHDAITQVSGSYRQTMAGFRNLLALGFPVEIRIVVSKLNIDSIRSIAQMILSEFRRGYAVHYIGLEMTGSAAASGADIWLSYNEAFRTVRPAIDLLVENGIDVALYNFPLCAVSPGYYPICAKSISPEKIEKSNKNCLGCELGEACGGVFSGSYRFAKDDLRKVIC